MTGILLVQLGTPDAPTKAALKPYLRQFLSDPRVIEVPKLIWWPILHGIILRTRPAASAEKYARIWDAKTGSPLMHYTKRQTELLQAHFPDTPVRFGMMIGNPSVEKVVTEMIAAGFDRLIVLPMFPQYSATTFASATDALFKTLLKVRRVPAVRIVPPYYVHPAYLNAVAAVIQDDLAKLAWQPDHLVVSFHGIPQSYSKRGDPYATQVVRTTRALLPRLGLPRDKWTQTYQSRFGKEPWLKPYTDDVLTALAKRGVKRVAVTLPGFTADCLETIDEIGRESREVFEHAGGEHLHNIPCLNDHPKWIEAMAAIVRDEGHGWVK
ncbi:ferrochelatase [Fimbriiglobus ruber]|uniref:Ferrochelatase n=1 Tax=Fimbriiglobus ruber TaxID=1908690 RepID=A0A225DC41_9BACT|nr:ferrochelatase [Fimbriiglobus ruber]OWK39052.1 Ferrochelatase, protoheme ferro-lyase [Fimbriiglobus ruber]